MTDAMNEAWAHIQGRRGQPLGGSTGASRHGDFVVKPGAHREQAENEYDMNRFLNSVGVSVPNASLQHFQRKPYLMTEFERRGSEPDLYDEATRAKLQRDFVPHAAIGNWDMLGLDVDNVLMKPDGTPTYVDVGGSGPWRAQGGAKGAAWGPQVSELDTMRYKPPNAQQVFGGMNMEDMGRSFDYHGGEDAMNEALQYLRDEQTRNVMQQRIDDIARQVA